MAGLTFITAKADAGVFSDMERVQIAAYWAAPERYRISVPDGVDKKGLWQVRLTPEGSLWFWKYQNAIGAAKAPPTQSPTDQAAMAPQLAVWKKWVDAKLAYDRWQAQDVADRANAALKVGSAPVPNTLPPLPPSLPGPIPPDLLAATGNPPAFANAVVPMAHNVTFDDGDSYTYTDNIRVGSPSYAYYRYPQGVMDGGENLRKIPDAQLTPLFTAAGFSPSEQRAAMAVSRLEGGFDSVNTYDTGYVSIGFIQFITGATGRGSLIEVLRQEKQDQPDQYAKDFHRYGIEVGDDGVLAVVDPVSSAELTGADAVQKTILDKRLTAIWQRAGRHSMAFRVAQVKVAKTHYWPADDPVTVTINGQTITGKVSDVIKSDAGMTTLFDRKVNRGTIAPFADVLTKIMTDHKLTTLADATPYEREIVIACRYRTDFLADKTLSQPK